MSPFLRAVEGDPVEPRPEASVSLTVDGQQVDALPGQTVAAALMATGRDSWRTTRRADRPRGVFCGIGACFDCLVVVNGTPDVRACQRTIAPGDTITTQTGAVLPSKPTLTSEELAGRVSTSSDVMRDPAGQSPRTAAGGMRTAPGVSGTAPDGSRPAPGASGGASGGVRGADGWSGSAPREVQVVVVGAGPAGIAAALAAGDAGVEVLLVDAGRAVGGQFHRQLPVEFGARRPERIQHGWAEFARDRDRLAEHSKITQLSETTVWAIETRPAVAADPGASEASGVGAHARASGEGARAGRAGAYLRAGDGVGGDQARWGGYRLWLQTGPADGVGRRISSVEVGAVVLAAGAVDRVLPFAGWELPGVYSAGAAQALAKGQRIGVGKRVLVAGTGPFLLPVAESLVSVGSEVVGLLEANALRTVVKGWSTDPLVARGKFAEAIGYAGLLARQRIPFKYGQTVIAAHGHNRVESVTTARLDVDWQPIPGSEREVEVDAVCLGFGFTAQLELAVSARCELGTGPDGGPAVIVDENQQTSTPGVFAAGELTGIGGAALAAAEGRVAGAAAAGAISRMVHVEVRITATTPRTTNGRAAAAGTSHGAALGATNGDAVGVTASGGDSAGVAGGGGPAGELGDLSQLARDQVAKGKRFALALGKAYPVKAGWRGWSGGETLVCRCEEVTRAELEGALAERDVTSERSLKLTSRAGLGFCQGRVCSRTVAEFADDSAVRAQHSRPIAVPVRLGDLARKEEHL